MRFRRFDIGTIEKPARTPQGGLRAPAYLTRTGILEYQNPDGSIRREYRAPDEVFKSDSLATLVGAPVTFRHPAVKVDASNYREYARGQVGENVRQDGNKVAATLYVQDSELLDAIESGVREVSCGYTCEVIDTPGSTPDGERYDAVQTNITYNHVAVVEKGRAGSEVAIRLDSAGHATNSDGAQMNKEFEVIEGAKYELGTDAHRAACDRRDAAATEARTELEKLQARCDAAESENKALKAEIAALPAKIAEQAKARTALENAARTVLDAEVKLDGLSDAEVRSLVATKAHPEMKLDGKSEAYVEALFDRAVSAAAEGTDGNDRLAAELSAPAESRADADVGAEEKAYAEMLERNRNAWKAGK